MGNTLQIQFADEDAELADEDVVSPVRVVYELLRSIKAGNANAAADAGKTAARHGFNCRTTGAARSSGAVVLGGCWRRFR